VTPLKGVSRHRPKVLERFMTSTIFVLYCVVGCGLSQPKDRVIAAFETLERCQEIKRNVESLPKSAYSLSFSLSCEGTLFEKDKRE
jgi:hypothetical protein